MLISFYLIKLKYHKNNTISYIYFINSDVNRTYLLVKYCLAIGTE